jgi:DNA-binding NarL/FixJ family response regulator
MLTRDRFPKPIRTGLLRSAMEMRVDSASGRGRGRTKVLVVDDHDGFRTGLAAILADEGFAVDTALNGEAAIARAAELAPDVVLMDVDMPGMSGAEAARRVLGAIGSVRVVMLGFHDNGRLEARRCGAHGYLSKAAPLEDVIATIAAAAYADRENAAPVEGEALAA